MILNENIKFAMQNSLPNRRLNRKLPVCLINFVTVELHSVTYFKLYVYVCDGKFDFILRGNYRK